MPASEVLDSSEPIPTTWMRLLTSRFKSIWLISASSRSSCDLRACNTSHTTSYRILLSSAVAASSSEGITIGSIT